MISTKKMEKLIRFSVGGPEIIIDGNKGREEQFFELFIHYAVRSFKFMFNSGNPIVSSDDDSDIIANEFLSAINSLGIRESIKINAWSTTWNFNNFGNISFTWKQRDTVIPIVNFFGKIVVEARKKGLQNENISKFMERVTSSPTIILNAFKTIQAALMFDKLQDIVQINVVSGDEIKAFYKKCGIESCMSKGGGDFVDMYAKIPSAFSLMTTHVKYGGKFIPYKRSIIFRDVWVVRSTTINSKRITKKTKIDFKNTSYYSPKSSAIHDKYIQIREVLYYAEAVWLALNRVYLNNSGTPYANELSVSEWFKFDKYTYKYCGMVKLIRPEDVDGDIYLYPYMDDIRNGHVTNDGNLILLSSSSDSITLLLKKVGYANKDIITNSIFSDQHGCSNIVFDNIERKFVQCRQPKIVKTGNGSLCIDSTKYTTVNWHNGIYKKCDTLCIDGINYLISDLHEIVDVDGNCSKKYTTKDKIVTGIYRGNIVKADIGKVRIIKGHIISKGDITTGFGEKIYLDPSKILKYFKNLTEFINSGIELSDPSKLSRDYISGISEDGDLTVKNVRIADLKHMSQIKTISYVEKKGMYISKKLLQDKNLRMSESLIFK